MHLLELYLSGGALDWLQLFLQGEALHLMQLLLGWRGFHLLHLVLSLMDLRLQRVNGSGVTLGTGQDQVFQALWSLTNLAAGRNLNKDS